MIFADFEYRVCNEYVELIKYIGSDTDVLIPDLIEGKPVRVIGSACFLLNKVSTIILNQNLTTIKDNAFNSCTELDSVFFKDKLESIGSNCFCGCRKLSEIILPDSVNVISDYAFSWCSSLTYIYLSQELQDLGEKAFCFCSKLTDIVIPKTVNKMGAFVFSGCLSESNPGFSIMCEGHGPGVQWDRNWNSDENVIWNVFYK